SVGHVARAGPPPPGPDAPPYRPAALRHLHPLPTRRSSDLLGDLGRSGLRAPPAGGRREEPGSERDRAVDDELPVDRAREVFCRRSEEHTSELQSREKLVCRLLRGKKNRIEARQTRVVSMHA